MYTLQNRFFNIYPPNHRVFGAEGTRQEEHGVLLSRRMGVVSVYGAGSFIPDRRAYLSLLGADGLSEFPEFRGRVYPFMVSHLLRGPVSVWSLPLAVSKLACLFFELA